MTDSPPTDPSDTRSGPTTILVQQRSFLWPAVVLLGLLFVSGLVNLILMVAVGEQSSAPREVYVSGSSTGEAKIALLEVTGTIMPPFTEHWIKTIKSISKDKAVKGVVLRVDSPGGLVADSHQIYHALNELREKTNVPIYVSMARIAASGGYYIAMGAGPEGRIFAEPTTWTGSIGVILPRYNAAELAKKIGVEADPLVTGKFKDTLSPLRDMTPEERELWDDILNESFVRFKDVILSGRKDLDAKKLDELATGQVYTAKQALKNGLVDEIGFRDDVVAALAAEVGLKDPKLVRYEYPTSLMELLVRTATGQAKSEPSWERVLGASVPQAFYFCGSPGIGLTQ